MSTARILVAEDERDIRELIVFALQLSGYHVTDVPNGEVAYQTAKKILPDLILMDVRMPRMTGYEACAALKKDETTKDIPVIFLSAKGQDSEMQQGLSLGAEAYFLKPFAPDELAQRVTEILAKHNKL